MAHDLEKRRLQRQQARQRRKQKQRRSYIIGAVCAALLVGLIVLICVQNAGDHDA